MIFSINQVAPLIANAGLTQNVTYNAGDGGGGFGDLSALADLTGITPGPASGSAITSLSGTPSTSSSTSSALPSILGMSVGFWIFLAAALYWFSKQ